MSSVVSFTQNFLDTLWSWLLPSVFRISVIVLAACLIQYLINLATSNFVSKFKRAERAETLRQITLSASKTVIVIIAVMMILHELGLDIRPIIASAGILSLSVSLGAQHLVKDIVNGFFILLEDQFSIGNTVKIGDISGTVEKMNLRTTTVKDLNGNVHIIPNSQINQVTVLKP